jgi:hypothetical protein
MAPVVNRIDAAIDVPTMVSARRLPVSTGRRPGSDEG